jgi:xanthine dehydrogenase YagS FAD-binding subunit
MQYYDAATVDEALAVLSRHMDESKVISGGVDLVSLIKNKVILPGILVNIKNIPELAYIREDSGNLKIGSLTSINQIEISTLIKQKYSLLADAAHSVASPQIRNMSTIAGNLCQQVWCWYYRRSPVTGLSFNCLRKGGKQCYAVAGDNSFHAIIGDNGCYAVCPSDMAVALSALGATLKIIGPERERIISLDAFYQGMGNILRPDEMITEVEIPAIKPVTRQRFIKFRQRKTIDFAVSSVAAAITTEAEIVTEARIFLGGVALKPYRAVKVEKAIKGKTITESIARESAGVWKDEASALSMNGFKVPITETLVRKAILE